VHNIFASSVFKEFINVNMRRVLVSSMTVIFIMFYCQLVKVTVAEHNTVITMSCWYTIIARRTSIFIALKLRKLLRSKQWARTKALHHHQWITQTTQEKNVTRQKPTKETPQSDHTAALIHCDAPLSPRKLTCIHRLHVAKLLDKKSVVLSLYKTACLYIGGLWHQNHPG